MIKYNISCTCQFTPPHKNAFLVTPQSVQHYPHTLDRIFLSEFKFELSRWRH